MASHDQMTSPPPPISSPCVPTSPTGTRRTKKAPSVTPRRFNRFFAPSSYRKSPIKASRSRRALKDITTRNTRVPSATNSTEAFPSGYESDENILSSSPVRKRRKLFVSSSPIAETQESDGLSLLSTPPASQSSSARSSGPEEPHPAEDGPPKQAVLPIRKVHLASVSGRALHRSFGEGPCLGRRIYCAASSLETSDFYSLPQDAYPVTRQGVTVPPFCTTSCKTNPVVAVGDETGRIRLLDTANKANQGISRSFYVINAHNNALLDLDFSSDDRLIATASGDQTSHVIDVRAGRVISRLDGHTSSVKRVQFQPGSGSDSIIVTSSRDGRVKLWDIRQKGKTVRQLQVAIAPDDALQMPKVDRASYALPITTISQAHPSTAPPTWPGMSKRQQAASRSQSVTPPSVTALSFLPPGREHLLLTASDSNACVRLWDTRWVSDGHVSTTQQPEAHDSYRPFGINSLALSGDGERVYSLCRDSTVYAYSTNHLILGHAPELSGSKSKVGKGDKTGLGPMYGFRHPKLHTGSFYVKMSLRKAKDDQTEMLGVGSTDGCPILFPTDEAIFKDGLSDAMGGLQLDDGPGNDVPSNSLRRTRSQTNNARSKPPGKPPCRPLDSIPIHQHGRALVEGHDREVTAPSWTSQGNLVSAGDDCLVRCWREGRNKSREVRREKATGCGWAQGVEGDAEDSEDD